MARAVAMCHKPAMIRILSDLMINDHHQHAKYAKYVKQAKHAIHVKYAKHAIQVKYAKYLQCKCKMCKRCRICHKPAIIRILSESDESSLMIIIKNDNDDGDNK